MSQERKSFTVSDRRHFTVEGEPRREDATSAEVEEAPPREAEPPSASAAPPGVPDTADFGSFIVSLAAQAGAALSEEGEGGGLEAARYLISVIEMLADKTQGRRSAREDELIAAVLYELRMAYVARSRAGDK